MISTNVYSFLMNHVPEGQSIVNLHAGFCETRFRFEPAVRDQVAIKIWNRRYATRCWGIHPDTLASFMGI